MLGVELRPEEREQRVPAKEGPRGTGENGEEGEALRLSQHLVDRLTARVPQVERSQHSQPDHARSPSCAAPQVTGEVTAGRRYLTSLGTYRATQGGTMSRFAFRTARVLAAVLPCVPLVARAQAGSFGSGSAVGVTIQAIPELTPAVGLHITVIKPSGIGLDFTFSTLPMALVSGLLILAPDVGLARVVPVGGGALMVKAGPSAVMATAGNEGAAAWGAHIGAAAFLRTGPSFGIRAEIVPRFYAYDGRMVQLTTFGIGFTSLPTRRR